MTVPVTEEELLRRLVARIERGVRERAARTGRGARDAHPKAHGLLHGSFVVGDDVPDDLRVGLFARPGRHPAWIRFSSAAEVPRSDRQPDVHGMAVKLMGVGPHGTTQDFFLVDGPRFFLGSTAAYLEFFEQGMLKYLAKPWHWGVAWRLVRMLSRPASPLQRAYFSQTSHELGDSARAVRYRVRPVEPPRLPARRRAPDDHLYEALAHHLHQDAFSFDFEMQEHPSPARDPRIDDPTVAWSVPFRRVARIELPRQVFGNPVQEKLGETLSFNPWHCLAEHLPRGEISRARRTVYAAISRLRHELNGETEGEPGPESIAAARAAEREPLDSSVHENVTHDELGVMARVKRGSEARVRELVDRKLGLAQVPGVHFARALLYEPSPEEPAWLMLATDFDGDATRHIAALVTARRDTLAELFACCEDRCDDVADFLREHRVPALASFVGARGRSVERVRAEAQLRDAIERFLDGAEFSGVPPLEIRRRIQEHVRREVSHEWVIAPPPGPRDRTGDAVKILVAALGALAIVLLLIGGVPAALGALGLLVAGLVLTYRHVHAGLHAADEADDPGRCEELEPPDHHEGPAPVQNWLTHVVPIKEGAYRLKVLTRVLRIIDFAGRHRYNQGKLGGIPTIFYARWLLLPETPGAPRRLVFFSNYGGSWGAYLDDFIGGAAIGLTAVWSNTANFPRTRPLFGEGARDGARFKRWTRNRQVATQYWESAYPELSVTEVCQSSHIRRGLVGKMTDAQCRQWLARFGSAHIGGAPARPRVEPVYSDVDARRVQGLVFRGYGHKRAAAYWLGRFDGGTSAARKFLGSLDVAWAPEPAESCVQVALTRSGLRVVGVDDAEVDGSFAVPFRCGMASDRGNRVLSEDHAAWAWSDATVHVAVLLYAVDDQLLASELAHLERAAAAHAVTRVALLPTTDLGVAEPFGFRDGIARVAIAGGKGSQWVAPGEVVLGHRDEYGDLAGGPSIAPLVENGSFLVIRQLEQDVTGFWQAMARLGGPDVSARIDLASRLVGRRPDGTPLTKGWTPGRDLDDMDYGADAAGLGCPLGAHVRRMNPRTELGRRHTILRRGRPYGPATGMSVEEMAARPELIPPGPRGLCFLALVGDLERQFEFLQQTWGNDPKLGGLTRDTDPIAGTAPWRDFTVQAEPVRRCVRALPGVVTVRGGGYFFMPGRYAFERLASR